MEFCIIPFFGKEAEMVHGRKIDAIPNEMTKRIFEDYESSKSQSNFTINAFLEKWKVSRSWFHKKRQQLQQLGHWKTKTRKPGPKTRILEPHLDELKNIVTNQPDATLEEICELLPVRVSHQTVANELDLMDLVYKKNAQRRRTKST